MELLHQDISPEDIEVFLQEAEEHLQLLDQDIVRLETEPDDQELLQQIFRSAHTLKGSSAMLGHTRMTEVAHSMENLLDRLRKRTATATTAVVDALLYCLDTLRVLNDELITGAAAAVDVAEVVETVEKANREAGSEEDSGTGPPLDFPSVVGDERPSPEAAERIKSLMDSGQGAYSVWITVSTDTNWAAVRMFQAHAALEALGEVVQSWPTMDEIQSERVRREMRVLVCSLGDAESLRSSLEQVEDLDSTEVVSWEPEKELSSTVEPDEDEADADVIEASKPESAGSEPTGRAKVVNRQHTVRVDVERLDHLMNTVGELVIDRTRIVQIGKALESKFKDDEDVKALSATASHIVKVVGELQESTMRVRMQPIGTVFASFPRMVRDLAQAVGKKVEFTIEGQDTEIDRTVIDRVRDPLVHLLRNAIDHGIETPEEREAAGKSQTARLHLAAFHEQGHIAITVEDDGRGIDSDKVRRAVVSKGLMTEDAAARLSHSEALDLIFMPGASTTAQTTEISGRGVGMDIVKTNIEAINGFVSLETELGQGTLVTLKMPLTLATLQTLLVELKQTTFAIPLVHVLETVKLRSSEISTIGGRQVTQLRKSLLPLLDLSEVFGTATATTTMVEDPTVVVVQVQGRPVGLAVETLLGNEEILVKSLGRFIGDVNGLSGASILADGRVVLIVDVPSLLGSYMSSGAGRKESSPVLEMVPGQVDIQKQDELPELAMAG